MVGQTEDQVKQTLCTITGSYRGTSNIRRLELVFSLKRNKFIKPYKRVGNRVEGSYIYALTPGRYILIGCKYWAKEEPPYTVYAQLFSIDNNCRVSYGKSMTIMFEHDNWLMSQALPQPLKDVYVWLPSYHNLPPVNFNKTYSEDGINQLMRMIENEVRLVEGAEHE